MSGQVKDSRKNMKTYTYTEGNTVRKLSEVPVRLPDPYKRPDKKRTSSSVKKNREKALRMNGPYVAFLAAAVFVCLFVCIQYLFIQADNLKVNDDIAEMEQQLDTLSAQNDSLDYTINSFIDINYIVNTAMGELGMVKATKDNVITFDSTKDEYVDQYKEVSK